MLLVNAQLLSLISKWVELNFTQLEGSVWVPQFLQECCTIIVTVTLLTLFSPALLLSVISPTDSSNSCLTALTQSMCGFVCESTVAAHDQLLGF